ncbi:arfaptin-2 isoform X2 [Neocloeon triangulifer]|uniref:arfaptin-2 isoform X2 n=1 Tax=Neocloeon triangulifer TaxID=2078957 RepID=UPI00286F1F0A|nr:arfaptin-2 isoform X2 [Neocloeon triangulifer]
MMSNSASSPALAAKAADQELNSILSEMNQGHAEAALRSHATSLPTTPTGAPKNGDLFRNSASKMETVKNWGISTYKCTRQLVLEKLGKSTRTVDTELETQIEQLRDTQRKYANILRLARALSSHFHHVVQTQHALGEAFSELAQKSPELQEEFLYNSESQRCLTKNGEALLSALHFFVNSVNTLCHKTIEDTLLTINQYEAARIEFDAYRADLEALSQAPRTDPRFEEAQQNYESHKTKFENLRADVAVKLKFLDENRIKVMHKQLVLFHNAISAYFSGNQQALESTLKQFNITVKPPSNPSWLEH